MSSRRSTNSAAGGSRDGSNERSSSRGGSGHPRERNSRAVDQHKRTHDGHNEKDAKRAKADTTKLKEKLAKKTAEEEKIRQRRERLASWRKKIAETAGADTNEQEDDTIAPSIPNSANAFATKTPGNSGVPKVSFKSKVKIQSGDAFEDEDEEYNLRASVERNASSKDGDESSNGVGSLSGSSPSSLGVSADILAQFKKAKEEKFKQRAIHEHEEEQTQEQNENEEEEDDEDPLDAFMQSVDEQVTKIKASDAVRLRNQKMLGLLGKSSRGEKISDANDGFDYPSSEEDEEKPGQPKYWSGYTPKQPRELGVPDHSKIEYGEFRKSFYTEVPELSRLEESEVAQMRFEMENIKTRGRDCPRPIRSWNQSGLSRRTLEILKLLKYDNPTPIQAQALPVILSGRDMLGIAKTGSGKTLAFLLPMLRHVMDQPRIQQGEGCIALILSPTRELAVQTYEEAKKFTKRLDLRIACVYGGSDIAEQIANLKRAVEIIVCTPGRMIDMLTVNRGKVTNTRRTTMIILDEADRMFDMGFEPQVMRILDNIRPDRQTVMFSATFPRAMEVLARKILKKPIEIQVGGRSIVSDTVTQHVLVINEENKFNKSLELLGHFYAEGNVIIFVHRQEKADSLLSSLISNGYMCLPLHGAVSQEDRQSNIRDFKQGNVKILIATSVAARGLDVKSLKLVINYDCPNHYEDYVHRCGRTGRAGNKGTAYTFVTNDDKQHVGHIIKALELSGQKPSQDLVDIWEAYKKEAKAQGKRVGASSGFRGRGYKFSAEEIIRRKQMKMLALKAHSEGNLDEDYKVREQELAEEIESQVDVLMGRNPKQPYDQDGEGMDEDDDNDTDTQKKVSDDPTAVAKVVESSKPSAPLLGAFPSSTANSDIPVANAGLTAVPDATSSTEQNSGGAQGNENTGKHGLLGEAPQGQPSAAALDPLTRIAEAMARAKAINQKYGFNSISASQAQLQSGAKVSGGQTYYEEEIEVNDWPQQARWKVTRKEFMQEVAESCGAAITVRGTYFPKGSKRPKGMENERPIYICIEAPEQAAVQRSISLCRQVLKEELHTAATTFQPQTRTQQPGRYRVLAITGN